MGSPSPEAERLAKRFVEMFAGDTIAVPGANPPINGRVDWFLLGHWFDRAAREIQGARHGDDT